MSRREVDRRGGSSGADHEPSERPRKTPAKEAAPAPRKQFMNEFFLDGEGIHREVLQGEICKFLGANATCRTAELKGRSGYMIRALRPFTEEMVEDLKTFSAEYNQEVHSAQRQKRNAPGYEASSAHQIRNQEERATFAPSPVNSSNPYPNRPGGHLQDPGHVPFTGGPAYQPGLGAGYPPGLYTTGQDMGTIPSYAAPRPDSGYQHYTYGHNQQGRPGDYSQQGFGGYTGTYPNYGQQGEYQDMQRRPDGGMNPNYYAAGPSQQRMDDSRGGYHDVQMGGMQPSTGPGYPVARPPNNPGYDLRETYGGRQQPADPYRRG